MKAAIYCRLSKEDREKMGEGDDSGSISNQKLLLIDYAIQQQWTIYNIYCDDDYSGLDKDRPAFNQMLADAQNNRFDIILCKHQSRFSRDMEEIEKYLHHLFLLWGVRFISLVDNVDTGVKGGKKSRQINGLVNEWYCEDISDNVRAALRVKKQNGQYLGYWCTYGYDLDPSDRHKLVVDPPAAKVVREIYGLYLQGFGVSAIANILTEKGYTTPALYKQQKGKRYYNPAITNGNAQQGGWAVSTIRRILRDQTYLGHLIQGRERKLSYKIDKVVKTPEDEWIIVPDNHEAIIDKSTFQKVQRRIGVKSASYKGGVFSGHFNKPHLFAGKAKCMGCGGNMHKRYGKGRVVYLKCALATKTKSKACSLHTIRLDTLTKEVNCTIRRIISGYLKDEKKAGDLLDLYWEKKNSADAIELQQQKRQLGIMEATYKNLSARLANAYADKIEGILSDNNFRILQQQFDNDLQQQEKKLAQFKNDIIKKQNRFLNKSACAPDLEKLADFHQLPHEMVNDFIDFIEIGEKDKAGQQEIIIHWLF